MKNFTLIGLLFFSVSVIELNAMEEKHFTSSEREKVNKAYDEIFYTRNRYEFDEAINTYKKLLNEFFPNEEPSYIPGSVRQIIELNRQRPEVTVEKAEIPGSAEQEAQTFSPFEQLPPELHKIIAQFLGNSIQETVKQIINLAQVNKSLYNQLSKNPIAIKDILIQKFGKPAIAQAFLDALKNSIKLDPIRFFFEFHLIDNTDIPLLNTINSTWLKELIFSHKANKLAALGSLTDRRQYNRMNKYGTRQPYDLIPKIIAYLIEVGFLDPNQEYNGKTILHLAFKMGDSTLWDMLLNSKRIDLKNPIQQKALAYASKKYPAVTDKVSPLAF